MHVIYATDVNEALGKGIHLLLHSNEENSRNGRVLVEGGPVTTVFADPTARVLLSPERDANPFFHLLGDALWCLSGSNKIAWPVSFNKNYASYSDDGVTQHAAYGDRWRWHFKKRGTHDIDQLDWIVAELTEKPESRQAVLTMWDPAVDLRRIGKDLPCNTQVYFDRRGDRLNMLVSCRSNDIVWGAYGANMVQFSVLQEVMAARIGCPVGVYRQMSNNYHLYPDNLKGRDLKRMAWESFDAADRIHSLNRVPVMMHGDSWADWHEELKQLMQANTRYNYQHPFFKGVVVPMLEAWQAHKLKDYTAALDIVSEMEAEDWQIACADWLTKRAAIHAAKVAS